MLWILLRISHFSRVCKWKGLKNKALAAVQVCVLSHLEEAGVESFSGSFCSSLLFYFLFTSVATLYLDYCLASFLDYESTILWNCFSESRGWRASILPLLCLPNLNSNTLQPSWQCSRTNSSNLFDIAFLGSILANSCSSCVLLREAVYRLQTRQWAGTGELSSSLACGATLPSLSLFILFPFVWFVCLDNKPFLFFVKGYLCFNFTVPTSIIIINGAPRCSCNTNL